MFQSLIGRLKTLSRTKVGGRGSRFQSLIGRLKTEDGFAFEEESQVFQSLIGRLKTVALEVLTAIDKRFNPS